eukprot:11795167-Alexandrium_andersonii.AAC.1
MVAKSRPQAGGCAATHPRRRLATCPDSPPTRALAEPLARATPLARLARRPKRIAHPFDINSLAGCQP